MAHDTTHDSPGPGLTSERIAGGILPRVLNSFDMVVIFIAIVLFITNTTGFDGQQAWDGWWLLGWLGIAELVGRRRGDWDLLTVPAIVYLLLMLGLAAEYSSGYGWYRLTLIPIVYLSPGRLNEIDVAGLARPTLDVVAFRDVAEERATADVACDRFDLRLRSSRDEDPHARLRELARDVLADPAAAAGDHGSTRQRHGRSPPGTQGFRATTGRRDLSRARAREPLAGRSSPTASSAARRPRGPALA